MRAHADSDAESVIHVLTCRYFVEYFIIMASLEIHEHQWRNLQMVPALSVGSTILIKFTSISYIIFKSVFAGVNG